MLPKFMHGADTSTASSASAVAACTALLSLALALLYVSGRPIATDDLWWHLKMGEVYATRGPWIDEDPLVHTTRAREPVQHEWLFQVAVHLLDGTIGLHGLRAIHVGAVAGILALAFGTFRRVAGAVAPAALATAVFGALSWYRLIQFRPDLLSIPLTFVLYRLVLSGESPPSVRRAAIAIGMLVLWANAHSIFAVGLALLFAACCGLAASLVVQRLGNAGENERAVVRARLVALAVILAIGVAATALNPRGLSQHATFVQYSAESAMWSIEDDWEPFNPFVPLQNNRALTFFSWLLADIVLLLFGAAGARAAWRAFRGPPALRLAALDPVHLALGAAGVVAMLVTIRFAWLSIFPLLYALRAMRREVECGALRARSVGWAAAAAAVLLALVFPSANGFADFAAEVAVNGRGYLAPAYLERRYCDDGSRFLADTELEGNLFNAYYLGGFFAYWHGPRLLTFIDGRMDHYPLEVYRDYQGIMRAGARGPSRVLARLLDERTIDVFFGVNFPEDRYENLSFTDAIRFLPEWVRVYQSHYHAIYLRRSPRNELNFFRVIAYYRERGLPFNPQTGLDVTAIVRSVEAERRESGGTRLVSSWAFSNNLLPLDYSALVSARDGADSASRNHALAVLGEHLWRIGDYEGQVALDFEAIALAPAMNEPLRRLADGLLQLGRFEEAQRAASELYSLDPEYADANALREATSRAVMQRERRRLREAGGQIVSPL